MLFYRLPISLLLLCYAALSFANTEIVNFDASNQVNAYVDGADTWPILRPGANEKPFSVMPAPLGTPPKGICSSPHDLLSKTPNCPHEIWIKLDMDDASWKSFSKFTLRISWPGSVSSPADFHINILNPETTATRFSGAPTTPSSLTRVKYARIRVLDTGVISPLSGFTEVPPVRFIVTLEPLYFGIVPATLIPFLWVLLPAIAVSILAVPYVNAYLQQVAVAAKREMAGKKE
ncbi:hypothetical protein GYMLUDRAFT_341290 [Collybiopsis luxurians FD-317 M1]|nr:hypothetical protein GYMLUDRAFT_341290 [Collybiopsis luxurians FD-317 M1]